MKLSTNKRQVARGTPPPPPAHSHRPPNAPTPPTNQSEQNVHPVVGCSPLDYRRLCGTAIWCLLMRRFWLRLSVFSSHFLSPQEDTPTHASPLATIIPPPPPFNSSGIPGTLLAHFVKESLLESLKLRVSVPVNPPCTVGSLLTKPRHYKRI